MRNRSANHTHDLRLWIDAVDPINLAQLASRHLPWRGTAVFIERSIGEKRTARWPQDSRHHARLTHRNRDQLATFALRAFHQIENWNAVGCVVGLNCDFKN